VVRGLARRLAAASPRVVGSPLTFVLALAVTLTWLLSGPLFHWSDNWILVPATATSIGAFLLVLLLQYSQNRDTRALQLKLDELIRSLGRARTQLVRLENMSDEELEQIESEFTALSEEETGE
jgi:low affinity Fe/Cu permease